MNKLSSTVPLLKDVSFGGPQSSLDTFSGMPSSSTKNGQGNNVFPATV